MKLVILRDYFFYGFDKLLPRWLAKTPYELALNSLRAELGVNFVKAVWERNSVAEGCFVCGVSDLDTTVLLSDGFTKEDSRKALLVIDEHKKRFPFLGEVNFLPGAAAKVFKSSINPIEGLRDQHLLETFAIKFDRISNAQKTSFLLRMIFADHKKLWSHQKLRQKKWRKHLQVMGLESDSQITKDFLIKLISELTQLSVEEIQRTFSPLAIPDLTDDVIFSMNLPRNWKFFFPNKYIWFAGDRDEEIELARGTLLGEVCLEQIKWEMWGLMTQFPRLKPYEQGLHEHLGRLARVNHILGGSEKIDDQITALLKLVSDYA